MRYSVIAMNRFYVDERYNADNSISKNIKLSSCSTKVTNYVFITYMGNIKLLSFAMLFISHASLNIFQRYSFLFHKLFKKYE